MILCLWAFDLITYKDGIGPGWLASSDANLSGFAM